MTVAVLELVETGTWRAALHPRGPDGRFTESFAKVMNPGEKHRARQIAAAFTPRRGLNTPDGARAYLSGLGPSSPAAATYFNGGHREVNQALRAGKNDYPGVKAMDDAMKPLPDDILVSRRVPAHLLGDATPEQLVGFKASDAGYTAASLAQLDGGPGDVMMHIAVPKGTRAAVHPDNGAIVLDRNLELAVLHVAPNEHGGRDMYLTVLPKDGHDDGHDGGLPHVSEPTARDSGHHTPDAEHRNTPDDHAGGGNVPGEPNRPDTAGRPNGDTSTGGRPDSTPAPSASDAKTGQASPDTPGAGAGVLERASAAATDEPASLGDTSPELHDAMHNAFDGTFGNLSVSLDDQVSQIYRDGDGNVVIRVEGYIRNKDGKIVGSFRRILHPDTGEVHNDTFALAGSEQGSGFAQQFAAHVEPLLAQLGMKFATVSASGVGGYAWRRYGWDPDNPAAAGDVPSRLRSITDKYDLSPEDKATVSGWVKAFTQPDQSKWPTPAEIGDFGKHKYSRKVDGRDIWPGKDVLVDSAWQGRRDLQTGRVAAN